MTLQETKDNLTGWIQLHRNLLKKTIWKRSTPEQKTILIALLLMANHKPNEWEWQGKRFKVLPGQFVTSLDSIVVECGKGISIQNVRSALVRFQKLEFLTDEATKTGRLITILNWDSYQTLAIETNKGINKGVTKNQQRGNIDLTPNNNDNNDNNDNNINISFDDFWNLYDKKVGDKKKLISKWVNLTNTDRINIMAYLPKYKNSQPEKKYRKNPETFLNQKAWNDEIINNKYNNHGNRKSSAYGSSFAPPEH